MYVPLAALPTFDVVKFYIYYVCVMIVSIWFAFIFTHEFYNLILSSLPWQHCAVVTKYAALTGIMSSNPQECNFQVKYI
jgi:hypothetical protein